MKLESRYAYSNGLSTVVCTLLRTYADWARAMPTPPLSPRPHPPRPQPRVSLSDFSALCLCVPRSVVSIQLHLALLVSFLPPRFCLHQTALHVPRLVYVPRLVSSRLVLSTPLVSSTTYVDTMRGKTTAWLAVSYVPWSSPHQPPLRGQKRATQTPVSARRLPMRSPRSTCMPSNTTPHA